MKPETSPPCPPPPGDPPLPFAWDRGWTESDLRRRLAEAPPRERLRLMAWILREARVPEVWRFLTPRDVDANLPALLPFLGRRRGFWTYLFGKWHELGKL